MGTDTSPANDNNNGFWVSVAVLAGLGVFIGIGFLVAFLIV